jgi:hypothetical protein
MKLTTVSYDATYRAYWCKPEGSDVAQLVDLTSWACFEHGSEIHELTKNPEALLGKTFECEMVYCYLSIARGVRLV